MKTALLTSNGPVLKETTLRPVKSHEIRLRVLERQQNRWLGRDGAIVSAIAIVVSTFITVIGWLANGVMR